MDSRERTKLCFWSSRPSFLSRPSYSIVLSLDRPTDRPTDFISYPRQFLCSGLSMEPGGCIVMKREKMEYRAAVPMFCSQFTFFPFSNVKKRMENPSSNKFLRIPDKSSQQFVPRFLKKLLRLFNSKRLNPPRNRHATHNI